MIDRSTVLVLQMAMGAYRQGFLDALVAQQASIRFLVGDRHSSTALVTEVNSPIVERTGANVFFFGYRLGYQPIPLRRALRAPVVVIELNPRNMTSWTVAVLRRVGRKRTYGWGHALPRSGRSAGLGFTVRGLLKRACHGLVMYTEDEAIAERKRSIKKHIVVAPNALYPSSLMVPLGGGSEGILWIGRMVEDKRPLLALEAFAFARRRKLPVGTHLHMVGDGPLGEEVRRTCERLGLVDSVTLHGTVNDTTRLQQIFGSCRLLFATGYVGLNAIQALGYGLPVIYPGKEKHAPEICALNSGNSVRFAAGDAVSAGTVLQDSLTSMECDFEPADVISKGARDNFSAEAMARGFMGVCEAAK